VRVATFLFARLSGARDHLTFAALLVPADLEEHAYCFGR
jgi:hypothetical protein